MSFKRTLHPHTVGRRRSTRRSSSARGRSTRRARLCHRRSHSRRTGRWTRSANCGFPHRYAASPSRSRPDHSSIGSASGRSRLRNLLHARWRRKPMTAWSRKGKTCCRAERTESGWRPRFTYIRSSSSWPYARPCNRSFDRSSRTPYHHGHPNNPLVSSYRAHNRHYRRRYRRSSTHGRCALPCGCFAGGRRYHRYPIRSFLAVPDCWSGGPRWCRTSLKSYSRHLGNGWCYGRPRVKSIRRSRRHSTRVLYSPIANSRGGTRWRRRSRRRWRPHPPFP